MLAQTTRTVCQRTASKTRPMEIGRDARKGIDRPGAFACQVFLKMATTGPNPRYDTARETMERDFGHHGEKPHELLLVLMVRQGRRYKGHIRTHTQHDRATSHKRHGRSPSTTPAPSSCSPVSFIPSLPPSLPMPSPTRKSRVFKTERRDDRSIDLT
jgi:hypothetical protein